MINLYDLLDAASGQLFGEARAQLFEAFAFHPDEADETRLFVALGADGGAGMEAAAARGAAGILTSQPPQFDSAAQTVILARDPLEAINQWAIDTLARSGASLIAVAGAGDRAVVITAIAQVLRAAGRSVLVAPAPVLGGVRQALPLTIAHLTPAHDTVLLDLDPQQPGDLIRLMGSVSPAVAVLVSAGEAHLDRFESADARLAELSALMEELPASSLAILNYDDDATRMLATRTQAKTVTVGVEGFGADVLAHNVVIGVNGTGFDLHLDADRFTGRWTPLLGAHHLYAVLAALALATRQGIAPEVALGAIRSITAPAGHLRTFDGATGALLVDHSADADPTTAAAALRWLGRVTSKQHRAIVILGDLDGMGTHSARIHRAIGAQLADVADLLITLGADAAQAGRAALDHGMPSAAVGITYSLHDAIARARAANLSADDVVLVIGGAAARMELVTAALSANAEDRQRLPRADRPDSVAQTRPTRASWVSVDLDAIASNVRAIKAHIGDGVTLFAVVKADAYGHGAPAIARTALLHGAEHLAVASIDEALALRDAGIDAPILVMSYTPPAAVRMAVRQRITVTLYDLELARAYQRAAQDAGGTLAVHIKIDTGMGRLGVLASEAVSFFRYLMTLTALDIEGIYTHFATADDDLTFAAEQLQAFRDVLAPLRAANFRFRYIHAANSAATLLLREAHFNAVRCGLLLYGVSPSALVAPDVASRYQPALTWTTTLAQVKTLPPGHSVGYGRTYRTTGEERIGVLPVGYADGLRRAPNAWGYVLIRGRIAPIRGRVSMEKTIVSLDDIPDAAIGDDVVILGRQGEQVITASAIAERIGTIAYEVLTTILPRLPRG